MVEDNNQPEEANKEQQKNPLLEKARIPGETFTLPSQGLFYTKGELSEDSKDGEVYIYPMVTLDEIILKTPDKLFSGEAITDVFSRCVPSVKKPMELLAKDVDFILVCLRKLTYGEEMEIAYTHDCEGAKEHIYTISMEPFIRKTKRIDPSNAKRSYTLDFENGQSVQLAPPKFGNVLKIYQAAADGEEADINSLKQDLTDTIVGMIKSVDDIEDPTKIQEWVEIIPAGWVHRIGEAVEKVSDWGPDFTTNVVCKDCGEEMEVSTPINPLAFFI